MWISLSQLKQELEIETDQYDDLLTRLAEAVERRIEAYCRRDFDLQWHNDKLFVQAGQDRLYLKNYPIVDVAAITVGDSSYDVEDVVIFSDEGVLYAEGGFSATNTSVEVCYCAGFTPIPSDLLTVLINEVRDAFWRWDEHQAEGIVAERLGEYSYRKVFLQGGWRPSSLDVLNYYRKVMQ